MVPVKKQIIAGSKPENVEPKRRPRNQELNSSKKETVQKIRRSLNSSMASDLDRLVYDVKASNATDYDEKYATLAQHDAYEEQLMADAYYKAEQKLSELYGIPNIMLETSVQAGHGRVDAFTDGGEPGCATLSAYDFEDETKAMWDLIKSWSGDTAGLVDAAAQKVVDLVEVNAEGSDYAYAPDGDLDSACGDKLNSSEEPDSVNPSEKDAQSLNSEDGASGNGWYREDGHYYADFNEQAIRDAMIAAVHYIDSRTDWDHLKSGKPAENDEEYCFRYDKAAVQVDDESLPFIEIGPRDDDSIKKLQNDDFDNALCYVEVSSGGDGIHTCYALGKDVMGAIQAMMENPYPLMFKRYTGSSSGDVDSSKKSMNCSEGDVTTVYTESGNEIAITDIKVVQNPQTNELALFIPENGDDEIPEGFTVIGTVISDTPETPAIEENAETGDDSLNSSKKPPMNRAQRRAAQRGARRPKKR